MSTHTIPVSVDVLLLIRAFPDQLRYPVGIIFANGIAAKPTALEFTPDLSPAEETTLGGIFSLASCVSDFETLNNGWWTWTAAEAETNIRGMIFNGKDLAGVELDIDGLPATIAGMKTGLKQAAAQIITLRTICIALAKMDVFLRNVAIKLR